MTEKNWGKIGAIIAFVAFVTGIIIYLFGLPISDTFTEATKYFLITLVIIFGVVVYFEFLKENKTNTEIENKVYHGYPKKFR